MATLAYFTLIPRLKSELYITPCTGRKIAPGSDDKLTAVRDHSATLPHVLLHYFDLYRDLFEAKSSSVCRQALET